MGLLLDYIKSWVEIWDLLDELLCGFESLDLLYCLLYFKFERINLIVLLVKVLELIRVITVDILVIYLMKIWLIVYRMLIWTKLEMVLIRCLHERIVVGIWNFVFYVYDWLVDIEWYCLFSINSLIRLNLLYQLFYLGIVLLILCIN